MARRGAGGLGPSITPGLRSGAVSGPDPAGSAAPRARGRGLSLMPGQREPLGLADKACLRDVRRPGFPGPPPAGSAGSRAISSLVGTSMPTVSLRCSLFHLDRDAKRRVLRDEDSPHRLADDGL